MTDIGQAILDCIERRSSTRQFDAAAGVSDEQRAAVLRAASRAPSAGAMMMYSIIDIRAQSTRDQLAVLCDNQPMIARAPWALVFVVDYCKWVDLFEHVGCTMAAFSDVVGADGRADGVDGANGADSAGADGCVAGFSTRAFGAGEHAAGIDAEACAASPAAHAGVMRPGLQARPGLGEFAIASQDAVIAAQNAVIAAEAVGLGTCYIGDIVERAEEVRELLDLPPYTVPLSMLILGVPKKTRPATPHPVENLVMSERYRRADAAVMDKQVAEMDAMFCPHATEAGARVRDIYKRKHASSFMAEMSRSMRLWLENWCGGAGR